MQPGVRDGNDIFGPLALAINLPFVVMTWGWFMAWGLPPDHQFPMKNTVVDANLGKAVLWRTDDCQNIVKYLST